MLSSISGAYFAGHRQPAASSTSGTIGNATWGSAVTVSSDGLFPGTSSWVGTQTANSWGYIPPSTDFNLGTGDFTFEWFCNHTQLGGFQRMFTIGNYDGADSPTTIGFSVEGTTPAMYFWVNGQARLSVSIPSYWAGDWHHVAVTRSSGILEIFVDGSKKASTPYAISISNTTLPLWIMSQASNRTLYSERFYGKMTNFRFVKGVAVYTGTYTVPTSNLLLTTSANPYGGSNTNAIPTGATKILLIP